jgi:hypothetical protein
VGTIRSHMTGLILVHLASAALGGLTLLPWTGDSATQGWLIVATQEVTVRVSIFGSTIPFIVLAAGGAEFVFNPTQDDYQAVLNRVNDCLTLAGLGGIAGAAVAAQSKVAA